MYRILIAIILLLLSIHVKTQTDDPSFDSTLAASIGADDYGMKAYIFVILKSGHSTIADKAKVDSLFTGHMQNIDRLAEEGKLVLAGPFDKNEKDYRGIFILNVKTVLEAKNLLDTDLAIKAGLLAIDIFEWYGSAAFSLFPKLHKKIKKKDF